MSAERAVCYVTDQGFLLPSLASAMRIRHFIARDTADIFVFTINVDDGIVASANQLLSGQGVEVVPVASRHMQTLRPERAQRDRRTEAAATFRQVEFPDAVEGVGGRPHCRARALPLQSSTKAMAGAHLALGGDVRRVPAGLPATRAN